MVSMPGICFASSWHTMFYILKCMICNFVQRHLVVSFSYFWAHVVWGVISEKTNTQIEKCKWRNQRKNRSWHICSTCVALSEICVCMWLENGEKLYLVIFGLHVWQYWRPYNISIDCISNMLQLTMGRSDQQKKKDDKKFWNLFGGETRT